MKMYYYNGDWLNTRQLSEHCNVPYSTLARRLKRGMSVEDAVRTSPPIPESIIEFDKESDYHDWNKMENTEIYDNYVRWCEKNDYNKVAINYFFRCLKYIHNDIKIVPTKKKVGNQLITKRILRLL